MILLFVEVPHANLSEVAWVILVHVGAVVVLTTGKTTTTGVLTVLADTTVAGRNVAAAANRKITTVSLSIFLSRFRFSVLGFLAMLPAYRFHFLSRIVMGKRFGPAELPGNKAGNWQAATGNEGNVIHWHVLLAGLGKSGRHSVNVENLCGDELCGRPNKLLSSWEFRGVEISVKLGLYQMIFKSGSDLCVPYSIPWHPPCFYACSKLC